MNINRPFYAHTSEIETWELLETHLKRVSSLSGEYGNSFNSSEWCQIAGLWHDLGKYSNEFQDYLIKNTSTDSHTSETSGKVDHSSAGAQWAVNQFGSAGKILAHIIAGHHSGLLDYSSEVTGSSLENRLSKELASWQENVPESIIRQTIPSIPSLLFPKERRQASFTVAFWIRMLYSCLVDADFLATEEYMNPEKASSRLQGINFLSQMKPILDEYMNLLQSKSDNTPVNVVRRRILDSCRKNAKLPPGFFDLCVPTGGGKTLASLTFALDHALKYNLQRVVVAIPFTSIIEQNAEVYRSVFQALGDPVLLEHHSNVEPEKENQANRLQSENWDAPLIVTTNVQFFESLFANRSSRCRKLHRIAHSVIILDEAQTLPVELLKPTLLALNELVNNYGCSVVLCSATKPALEKGEDFSIGIENIRHIVEPDESFTSIMKRTSVKIIPILTDEALTDSLIKEKQVLCIVNTRRHASILANQLGKEDGHFHLSTRMCPVHRLEKLKTIKERLKNNEICRVVSTQLIEAGVDVDFPSVYRAQCGLDSLTQAAGRCNREGRRELGDVVFFKTPELLPPGMLRQTADAGEEIIHQYADPMASEAIEAYFFLHYWRQQDLWDKYQIIHESTLPNDPSTMQFQFSTMAKRYQFIKEESSPLLVPWEEQGKKFRELLWGYVPPSRNDWRRIQRYCIQIRKHELEALAQERAIEFSEHGIWMLIDDDKYDEQLGLVERSSRSYENFIL